MKATEFEFRRRFWFIMAIYAVGFSFYAVDQLNAAQALVEIISGHSIQSAADRHHLQAIFGLGAVFAALAALIRAWAAAYLHSGVVHDSELHAERLVADGPYRYVRNPLYLGAELLAIGFGLLASRSGCVLIVVGHAIFYARLIGREEAALLETQGDSYRQYLNAVPAFIPSLTPRLPPGGKHPRWGQGFLGEMFLFLFAASIAAFSLTLSSTVLDVAIGVALLSRPVTMPLLRRLEQHQDSATGPPPAF
jgi:protein-S-isoprenylcysteine O-methyltransferase Ste14